MGMIIHAHQNSAELSIALSPAIREIPHLHLNDLRLCEHIEVQKHAQSVKEYSADKRMGYEICTLPEKVQSQADDDNAKRIADHYVRRADDADNNALIGIVHAEKRKQAYKRHYLDNSGALEVNFKRHRAGGHRNKDYAVFEIRGENAGQ
jgi:hypothetical protein